MGVIITLVFLLPVVLPFIVSGSMLFPFITGKNFTFRIITELVLGSWVILAMYYEKFRPRVSLLSVAFVAFAFIVGLADVLGENVPKSLWSNNERMEGLITIVHLLALFVVIAYSFTEKVWTRLIQTSLVVSTIVFLQGVVELSQGIDRIDGSFGNSTYLGVYSLLHIFFALFFVVREIYPKKEVVQNSKLARGIRFEHVTLYSLLAIINVTTLFFTGTRGALLGLVGGITVMAIIYAIRERAHKALRITAFAILAIELVATLFLVSVNDTEFAKTHPLVGRFSNLATALVTFDIEKISDMGDARFNIWGVALDGVRERPLLGWGQDNFTYVFSKYYNPELFEQEQWFDRTHNVFFDWLIAGGILGLLSYLMLFVASIWIIWKNKHGRFTSVEQGLLTGLFVAYFVHNFFVFDNLVSYVFIVFVFGYIQIKSHPIPTTTAHVPSNSVIAALPIALAIITLAVPFVVNVKNMSASSAIISAISKANAALQAKNANPNAAPLLTESLEDFKRVYTYNSFSNVEASEQLLDTAARVATSDFPNEIKSAYLALAAERLEIQLAERPDTRGYILYGTYNGRIGNMAKAEENLLKARESSPTKQSLLMTLAQIYLAQGKSAEALAVYKEAYELDASFNDPKLTYALALAQAGQAASSSELLSQVSDVALLNVRYINTYLSLGRYDLIVKTLEKALESDPNNVEYNVSLAAAYLQTGNRIKPVEILEGLKKIDAKYTAQVDKLVSEIEAGRNPLDK